jgi:flagellar protein FliS
MMNNPYEIYKRQDLETSNKQELVGKLFNEASLSLKRAVHAIEGKKFDVANENIKKSEVIVKTLNQSLDMQYDISHQLRNLYGYMFKRMYEANMKKDVEILKQVSGMLDELRDTWLEAMKACKKTQLL